MTSIRISDPAKSLERIYDRIHEAQINMATAETDGLTALVPAYRRRIAALQASATRIARSM